jgi:hypothetical protein
MKDEFVPLDHYYYLDYHHRMVRVALLQPASQAG